MRSPAHRRLAPRRPPGPQGPHRRPAPGGRARGRLLHLRKGRRAAGGRRPVQRTGAAGGPARRHPPSAGDLRRLPAGGGTDPDPDRQPRQGKLLPDAAARHEPGRPRRRPARRTVPPGRLYLATGHLAAPGRPATGGGSPVRPDAVSDADPLPDRRGGPSVPGPRREEPPPDAGLHRSCTTSASPPASIRAADGARRPHRRAGQRPADAVSADRGGRRRLRRDDLPDDFAYIALGHIHQPQSLGGRTHVRYSGSIERLDLGERPTTRASSSSTSVPRGCAASRGSCRWRRRRLDVEITSSQGGNSARWNSDYPEAKRALVRIGCTYTAGVDNREEMLRGWKRSFRAGTTAR